MLSQIGGNANCRCFPSKGIPTVMEGHKLPEEVRLFYRLSGGLELFTDRRFGFRIVSPEEVVTANPVIFGAFYNDHRLEFDEDTSSSWYIIARGKDPGQIISIDCGLQRNGFCYDSFWEVHASRNAKIVARGFADLVVNLFEAQGTNLYWERESFNLGYAGD